MQDEQKLASLVHILTLHQEITSTDIIISTKKKGGGGGTKIRGAYVSYMIEVGVGVDNGGNGGWGDVVFSQVVGGVLVARGSEDRLKFRFNQIGIRLEILQNNNIKRGGKDMDIKTKKNRKINEKKLRKNRTTEYPRIGMPKELSSSSPPSSFLLCSPSPSHPPFLILRSNKTHFQLVL
jgi:hypothetical protein